MSTVQTPVPISRGSRSTSVANTPVGNRTAMLEKFPTTPENTGDAPAYLLAKQAANVITASFSMARKDLVVAALYDLFNDEGIATTLSLAKFEEDMFPTEAVSVDINGSQEAFPYYGKKIFRRTFMELAHACQILAQEGRHLTMTTKASDISYLAELGL